MLSDGIDRVVYGTALGGVERLSILGRAAFQMRTLKERWRDEVEALRRELGPQRP